MDDPYDSLPPDDLRNLFAREPHRLTEYCCASINRYGYEQRFLNPGAGAMVGELVAYHIQTALDQGAYRGGKFSAYVRIAAFRECRHQGDWHVSQLVSLDGADIDPPAPSDAAHQEFDLAWYLEAFSGLRALVNYLKRRKPPVTEETIAVFIDHCIEGMRYTDLTLTPPQVDEIRTPLYKLMRRIKRIMLRIFDQAPAGLSLEQRLHWFLHFDFDEGGLL